MNMTAWLLLAAFICPCLAAAPVEPKSEDMRFHLFADATYRTRVLARGEGWHTGELMVRVPVRYLFGEGLAFAPRVLDPHQATFVGGVDGAFGTVRNPLHAWAVVGYTFGKDYYAFHRREDKFTSFATRGEFPWSRSVFTSAGLGLGAGYEYRHNADATARGANFLRVQHWAFVGLGFFELRVDAALIVNPTYMGRVWPEVGASLHLGRPMLPFALTIGWSWTALEVGGGHALNVGARFAL